MTHHGLHWPMSHIFSLPQFLPIYIEYGHRPYLSQSFTHIDWGMSLVINLLANLLTVWKLLAIGTEYIVDLLPTSTELLAIHITFILLYIIIALVQIILPVWFVRGKWYYLSIKWREERRQLGVFFVYLDGYRFAQQMSLSVTTHYSSSQYAAVNSATQKLWNNHPQASGW